MSRNILIILSALAISACSDNRPNDANPHNQDAGPGASRGDARQGRSATDNPSNQPFRTDRVSGQGVDSGGTDNARSTDRTVPSPGSADRGDAATSTLTAGDQSENETDRRITQQIREAVVADPTLSIKAKNCTIITINGIVTLRGSVDTANERRSIGSKADGVPGVRQVDNNLALIR